jgi:FkbM family methyltransferase
MAVDAYVAAAYVEAQRWFGFKPDVKRRVNALLRRPIEDDFRVLAHYCNPAGHLIVDIGANRGETIAAARLFQPVTPIVAFEPNPILVNALRRRFANDANVRLVESGLGAESGQFDLFVPYYKGVPFDGLASFRRSEAETFLNRDRLIGFDARHQTIRAFSCAVATLDSFALNPGFMKIDVQGLEPAVIRGALGTIERSKPIILMENNAPDLDATDLLARGYVRHAYRDGRLVAGELGALNTFYIHPATRDRFASAAYA